MTKMQDYKQRLQHKKIFELKAIYLCKFGKDLLRGNKQNMINQLSMALDMPRQWQAISR